MAAAHEPSATRLAARADAQAAARRVHGAPTEQAEDSAYAGLVTRAIAFAIDAAVINLVGVVAGVVVSLVFSVLPESEQARTAVVAAGGALFVVWMLGYFVAFWTTTGQTVGGRIMQIRVTRANGSPLHPRHALTRLVGIGLAALPLCAGFLPILVTDRRRGLHDMMARTVVRSTGT